jgi:hypothetical protein
MDRGGNLRMNHKRISASLLMVLLFVSSCAYAQDVVYDSALWTGATVLFEREDKLSYSVEYQLRMDDHMGSYSSDFIEFMGYKKHNENLLFNSGYRFTRREDHNESRLYFGGFLDLTKTAEGIAISPSQFKVILQFGYQHDFNTEVDGISMGSNSIRTVLVASKPATKKITPFLIAGVLTTWNDANSFGLDKIRLGGGAAFQVTKRSRLRCQYMWEESHFVTPKERTNILWLRYEAILGK